MRRFFNKIGLLASLCACAFGQDMGALSQASKALSRQVSPENPTGEPGKGALPLNDASRKYLETHEVKLRPSIAIQPGQTVDLAAIAGPGTIKHLWMTPTGNWRLSILRIYWDGEAEPSVEVPVGDFFCMGWGRFAPLSSLAVCVDPGSGFNCYWDMPFRRSARLTMQNLDDRPMVLYYQVDYELVEVPASAVYFHAQFRRVDHAPENRLHTILGGVRGEGQYVGTYLAWGSHAGSGWWGEGEVKFYLDGDAANPTICGTGTEDYFGGAYNYVNPTNGIRQAYSTPYSGLHQVIEPNGGEVDRGDTRPRFGMYRWHVRDPVHFHKDLRVTINLLNVWNPAEDDLFSVAYWYQAEPHAPFPTLPDKNALLVR